ncbi:hypothetical protein [Streptomyces sp. TLI_171]|uniref:hypothetical protein n=1 Tax=Streptomyces sp. TLI_171 TaxID=1938859 RepID=UPI000C180FC5|nr:hypothetical protein [Streptomyces sp. TLI_171]RKE02882.1 hypothetical protein BX266_7484 [Streptomyces sp. TLI_171]
MTITHLPVLDTGPGDDGMDDSDRTAVADAAGTGLRAALWIRSLAARQTHTEHRRRLEAYAEAVERVLTRELVAQRDEELGEELRHAVSAYSLTWSPPSEPALVLRPRELVALAAIGAAAASAPLAAIEGLGRDLARFLALIDAALDVGLARCRRVADQPSAGGSGGGAQ